MNDHSLKLTLLLLLTASLQLDVVSAGQTNPSTWQVEAIATLPGFHVPECAFYDAASGQVFVSNIESSPDAYWSDDNKGYISTLDARHRVKTHRWLNSQATAAIHSPKGMCRLGKHLYFTDNTRLMRVVRSSGKDLEVVASGFTKANDLASDGKELWLSDTAEGKVYGITPEGVKREVPAPASVNGVTCAGKKLFAVSWDLHEVYELDPTGKKAPRAFGLASHFTNLDGIEVLADGSFLVSDFVGNKISWISADRSSVETVLEIDSPADIGFNPEKQLLYIPQFMKDQVVVIQLTRPR